MVMTPRDEEDVMSRRKERSSSLAFVTAAEFARITNTAEATVYRLLAAGRLEGLRFGRAWRLPVSQLGISVNLNEVLSSAGAEE